MELREEGMGNEAHKWVKKLRYMKKPYESQLVCKLIKVKCLRSLNRGILQKQIVLLLEGAGY